MSSRTSFSNHPQSNGLIHQQGAASNSQASVPKGTGSAYHQSALEKKLELLEVRLTQPLQSPASTTTAQHLSPLTSNLHFGSHPQQSNSQHSFAFDSPTNGAASTDSNTFLRTRSKRSPVQSSALDQLRVAADRQIQKVAAAATTQRLVVASSSCSEISSDSTRIVQNHHRSRPVQSRPARPLSHEPVLSAPQHQPLAEHSKKRKSTPVKVEEPSVKENIRNANNSKSTARSGGQTKVRSVQRKLVSRAEDKRQDLSPATAKLAAGQVHKIREEQRETSCSSLRQTTPPPQKNHLSPRRSGSRDAPPDGKKSSRVQRSLHNNASIHDFFNNLQPTKRRKMSFESTADKEPEPSRREPTSNKPKRGCTGSRSPDESEVPLQQRIFELERTCKDQEEQLKAVANNRTILHTALQSALDQREKELGEVQAKHAAWTLQSRKVVEAFVRAEAAREARQVRERLATDGARLGRIVYSRSASSFRSGAVETWEEGHAIRQLASRQVALRDKRKRLEERYRSAQKAAQQWSSSSPTPKDDSEAASPSSRDGEKPVENVIGGVPIRSKMDALEAVESARCHLENMRRKERDLQAEEHALNDEKGTHIRALKRVASEDASRFRAYPTNLNDRYVLKCLLGKGGFSEVWRAYDLVELREVAVKIHQLDPRWSEAKKENYTKHVSREYEIHRNVRHPRIVSLFDVFEIDNNSFATVLELCEGTDLDTLLKEKRRLPERDARAILLQILSGMQYLSRPGGGADEDDDAKRQPIIHYDLKPGNILFDEFGDAKITDFGLSKIVDANDPAESMELTSQGAGTYWYLPPECFVTDETVRISNKVDVWSIGVIFYQMLFGRRPFGDGQSQDGLLTNQTMLNARQVTFPDRPDVSEECKTFIRKCLSYDQAFRPTVAQLCQQPYVTRKGS